LFAAASPTLRNLSQPPVAQPGIRAWIGIVRRAELRLVDDHPRVRSPLIARDWERLEGLLLEGLEPAGAARSFGRTLSDFRRDDYARHQRLLRVSREARADAADRDLDGWAHAVDASDAIRMYWHRYVANAAGRGIERAQLELSVAAPAEDRSASLADVVVVLREAGALAVDEPVLERGAVGVEVADARELVAASS
jgi:hypothetical protein